MYVCMYTVVHSAVSLETKLSGQYQKNIIFHHKLEIKQLLTLKLLLSSGIVNKNEAYLNLVQTIYLVKVNIEVFI